MVKRAHFKQADRHSEKPSVSRSGNIRPYQGHRWPLHLLMLTRPDPDRLWAAGPQAPQLPPILVHWNEEEFASIAVQHVGDLDATLLEAPVSSSLSQICNSPHCWLVAGISLVLQLSYGALPALLMHAPAETKLAWSAHPAATQRKLAYAGAPK